ALKQRRTGDPTPLNLPPTFEQEKQIASSPVAATPPASAASAASPLGASISRANKKVHSNCPACHGLSFFYTPEPGWWCSVCETEHGEGSAFYGCRTCDYDECERCALAPRATPPAVAAAAEAAKETVTPAAAAEPEAPRVTSPPVPKASKKSTPKGSPDGSPTLSAQKKSSSSSSGDRSPRSAPAPAAARVAKKDAKKESSRKEDTKRDSKKGDSSKNERRASGSGKTSTTVK
ncbi:unnamed protein product, partial [Polarella glacialis]